MYRKSFIISTNSIIIITTIIISNSTPNVGFPCSCPDRLSLPPGQQICSKTQTPEKTIHTGVSPPSLSPKHPASPHSLVITSPTGTKNHNKNKASRTFPTAVHRAGPDSSRLSPHY
ncbi:hypothetical protein E2C01_060393 [Portunus trituberculatus]|uniref:Uncharacterized protein n=1 Tax=Portunus trituberculatus TaxID=210409 RepID=A0A5B7H8K8_PORTR|nr:hypothetical protein [Portunus trituberculatus]